MLLDTATIDLVYDDATPTLSAAVVEGSINTRQLTNHAVTYAKNPEASRMRTAPGAAVLGARGTLRN